MTIYCCFDFCMFSVHVSIYGLVQGVGYRRWLKMNCDKNNLFGWTRNSSDGSVECFFQGDKEKINTFLILCWEGPENSEVEDILEKEGKKEETLNSFEIL